MPNVELIIGGTKHKGWMEISITRSLEAVSGAFDLAVTERYPGEQAKRGISPGDACRLAVDDEVIITGYVDDVGVRYDARSHRVVFRGRDATGDLVDCSAIAHPNHWDADILTITRAITKDYNIKVSADPSVDVSSRFNGFVLQDGETVFETIDRMARTIGVMAVSDGQGGLVFTRAGSAPANTRLKLGVNILTGEFRRSHRQRFSEYRVYAQSAGGQHTDPEASVQINGFAEDPGITRHRPLIVLAEIGTISAQNALDRAKWEASVRYGRAWRGVYRVPGWRDAAGKLWRPNSMVEIYDTLSSIYEPLLICGVKNETGENGTTTELTVTRREAFELAPLHKDSEFDRPPRNSPFRNDGQGLP